jgi:hypothetical protein
MEVPLFSSGSAPVAARLAQLANVKNAAKRGSNAKLEMQKSDSKTNRSLLSFMTS